MYPGTRYVMAFLATRYILVTIEIGYKRIDRGASKITNEIVMSFISLYMVVSMVQFISPLAFRSAILTPKTSCRRPLSSPDDAMLYRGSCR